MKRSKKVSQGQERQPSVSYDDVVLAQKEAEAIQMSPDLALDVTENTDESWEAVEANLDEVTGDAIRRNVAQVDARAWLQASKTLATEVKKIAETATSKKEIFKIDAAVDAFDRDMKARKINIQPCRLHCQNAIRDAYARLS